MLCSPGQLDEVETCTNRDILTSGHATAITIWRSSHHAPGSRTGIFIQSHILPKFKPVSPLVLFISLFGRYCILFFMLPRRAPDTLLAFLLFTVLADPSVQ